MTGNPEVIHVASFRTLTSNWRVLDQEQGLGVRSQSGGVDLTTMLAHQMTGPEVTTGRAAWATWLLYCKHVGDQDESFERCCRKLTTHRTHMSDSRRKKTRSFTRLTLAPGRGHFDAACDRSDSAAHSGRCLRGRKPLEGKDVRRVWPLLGSSKALVEM